MMSVPMETVKVKEPWRLRDSKRSCPKGEEMKLVATTQSQHEAGNFIKEDKLRGTRVQNSVIKEKKTFLRRRNRSKKAS